MVSGRRSDSCTAGSQPGWGYSPQAGCLQHPALGARGDGWHGRGAVLGGHKAPSPASRGARRLGPGDLVALCARCRSGGDQLHPPAPVPAGVHLPRHRCPLQQQAPQDPAQGDPQERHGAVSGGRVPRLWVTLWLWVGCLCCGVAGVGAEMLPPTPPSWPGSGNRTPTQPRNPVQP